jgi:hypothetical protein
MTKRYTGGVVSSSLPTVNAAGASGVFLLSQQADAQSRNAWPPYKIEESLRFRAANSAYLNRTPAVAGNRRTFTYSGWLKRGALDTTYNKYFFSAKPSVSVRDGFYFGTNQTLSVFANDGSSALLVTSQVFRDPSAWYHIVVAIDTTQATASNRIKLYVNGVQVTAFGTETYPSQNYDWAFNNTVIHTISDDAANAPTGIYHFDGYMSEVNFVDGQALTPSAFGATDKDGNWSPIAYTGTYGQNGFYVNFRDNTSATTMGYDYSGNGNNWTLNNFNVSTANTSYDIMIDVPEDQSDGTANNRGNYATLNPLAMYGTNVTISDGSLTSGATSTSNDRGWPSTIAAPGSGKWYAEFTFTSTLGDNNGGCGIMLENGTGAPGESATTVSWRDFGTLRQNASGTSYGSALTTNDVVMVAYDASLGRVWFGKNGTWFASGDPATNANPSATGITTTGRFATYHYSLSAVIRANFGQRPFVYTPPSGFKALNTFNLPEPTIKQPNKYFDATIWTGDNASPRAITNSGLMQPDWVWVKRRNGSAEHTLFDAVRGFGGNKELSSNTTGVEGALNTSLYGFVSATNSTGFQLTAGSTDSSYTNRTGDTYVGWQWNAGNANTTNTSGSVTSIVRANPTAGFSIVTYTATAADPITVGHGLGVAPSMFMVKSRSASGTDWFVYHSSLGATKNLRLNTTAAAATATNVWNDTAPTSSVITTSNAINTNGVTYVAYCFAPIAGYSAFGTYIGNASTDGPFVYTGFRPRWVMVKNTTSTQSWQLMDTSRSTYNAATANLLPNSSSGELTGTDFIDMLSNGFKIRQSSAGNWNNSGDTYIYMAFAEAPFKYARSR